MRIVNIRSTCSVSVVCKGNLSLRFIQSFRRNHVSSVTTCLPLPKSAASPLEWGILTLDLNQTFEAMIDNGTGILTLKESSEKMLGLGKWAGAFNLTNKRIIDILWHVNEAQNTPFGKGRESNPGGNGPKPCEHYCWGMGLSQVWTSPEEGE